MSLLITGADGFVGKHLCLALAKENKTFLAVKRKIDKNASYPQIALGNLNETTNWQNALNGIDTVVHLANVAHRFNVSRKDCYLSNVLALEKLLKDCTQSKVKQFIYLSSIKVYGEKTNEKAFDINSDLKPVDVYAHSKLQAENLIKNSGITWTIIRPPLIYGKGVKGNFAQLLKYSRLGIPLPLKGVNNQRSLLGIDNLIDFINTCIANKKANNAVFLVSDNEDTSTPELLKQIATSQNKKARLFYLPIPILRLIATITGQKNRLNRLIESLTINSEYTHTKLNWQPKLTRIEQLKKIV